MLLPWGPLKGSACCSLACLRGGEGGSRARAAAASQPRPACQHLTCLARPLSRQVDVEGFEPAVLRGAKRLLAEKRVAHLFMEYSPGVAGERRAGHAAVCTRVLQRSAPCRRSRTPGRAGGQASTAPPGPPRAACLRQRCRSPPHACTSTAAHLFPPAPRPPSIQHACAPPALYPARLRPARPPPHACACALPTLPTLPAEKWQDWRWFEEHPRALLGLLRDGYGVLHLAPVHGDWPDWSGARAMNKMEEVGGFSERMGAGCLRSGC